MANLFVFEKPVISVLASLREREKKQRLKNENGESQFLRVRVACIKFTSQQETSYLWLCLHPFTSWLKGAVASDSCGASLPVKRHARSHPERVRVRPDKVIDSQMPPGTDWLTLQWMPDTRPFETTHMLKLWRWRSTWLWSICYSWIRGRL